MCFAKSVHNVDYFESDSNNQDCDIVSVLSLSQNPQHSSESHWFENLTINNVKINFKLDTGAQINVIFKNIFEEISNNETVLASKIGEGNFRGIDQY